MSRDSGITAYLARAEGHVRQAQKSWDATSLSGCAECAQGLRLAVAEMEGACAVALQGPPPAGTETRLERLRSDVDQLSRLVDSAMAFYRGMEWSVAQLPEEAAHSEMRG
jgi:hypothetical protein